MNLNLSEDQKMLQETVARLFQAESSAERIRAAEESGHDPVLWGQLVEMGMHLMRVPEAAGGLAMDLMDAALVCEQAGRYLATVPLAEAIVAAGVIGRSEGDVASQWQQNITEGALVSLVPEELKTDRPVLAPGAGVADAVLALEGDTVVLIAGLEGNARNTGSLAFGLISETNSGQRTVVAQGEAARTDFLAAIEEWKILNAAVLAGLSRKALDMAAEYACEREQFGRPIGGYQGIAHPLADCLGDTDSAQLLVWHAIWAIARQRPDAAAAVAMARWWANRSTSAAVARSLHTFGGYGVSLEYDIQLYYRRGKALALQGGDPDLEIEQVADRLWPKAGQTVAVPLPDVGTVTMDFSYGEAGEVFAKEVRDFFEANMTDELRAKAHHSVSGYDEGFSKKLAAAGLRYPHWPKSYGGREATPFEMAALNEVFEEYNWERITGPITNQVAQILMMFGTDEAKAEILPRFGRGDALACLGLSEPSSGSDMFAAKTRAVRDGDDWVVEGQKIFTTAGNLAHYLFLLARTDPEAPKHRGITIFIVPMDLPGIELQPVYTLQDERTNITYLSNLRVPDKYRIGEINGGLQVMASTMELEHSGDQYRISYSNMFRHAVEWAQKTKRDGELMITKDHVRRRLARVAVHTTAAKALCYRAIWAVSNKIPHRAHMGPMSKVFSTEYYQRDSIDLMDLAAPESLLPGNEGLGHVEIGYRQSIGTTIYGGTSEVQRSLIAEQGLKMPKSRS